MAKYLLDTTTLIGHRRGRQNVVALVSELVAMGHRLGVCPVSIAELYAGIGPDERAKADQLTSNLEHFQVTAETAKEAGRYRQDAALRSTALSATSAAAEFSMDGVRVLEHG